ncbi:MAG: Mth938-like domain-containing protein [Pseudomonadota bacterium]|nr:Mth938-like domain-containing protein [Pseudomonadota bacterium]
MKFHLATPGGHVVTGTGPGWIRVGTVEYRHNLVLTPTEIRDWSAGGYAELTADDFAALLADTPEVVLLGTGRALQFPHPRLTQSLSKAGIGLEVMGTPAACRTYNILAAEGRRVTAALILES